MSRILSVLVLLLFFSAIMQAKEAATYEFQIDRFEFDIGYPVRSETDEFDNGALTPDWSVEDRTADESDGVVHLRSPGAFMKPFQPGEFLIIEERSSIQTTNDNKFNIPNGVDYFTGTSVWKSQIPSENQFFGMQTQCRSPSKDTDINLNVVNVGKSLADALGTSQGLKIWFHKETDSIQDFRWYSIDENDISGDILLRLALDDGNNQVTASFSLNGGSSWQAPFESVAFTPCDIINETNWMLEAAELTIYTIQPNTCAGDLDKDGDVDAFDLATFALEYGSTECWTCQDDDVVSGIYRICNYWPLNRGNQWIYTTGDRVVLNETRTCLSGCSGIRYGTTQYEYENFMENGESGLVIAGCGYENGSFFDRGICVLFPPEMEIGDSAHFDFSDWTIDWTFLGLEAVTVPADSFQNTLKIEFVIVHKDGSCSYKTTLWLAKGVGPVKIHRTDADPSDCLGCLFVCDPNNDIVKLNTPAELTSAVLDGKTY